MTTASGRPPGAGSHPDFMLGNEPNARETYATVGDRIADAWARETGYRWTRIDHRNVRKCLSDVEDLEGFFEFVMSEWATAIEAEFWWRTRSPAPSQPDMRFLISNRETFLRAWHERHGLHEKVEKAHEARERRIAWEREEARRNEREDRHVVEAVMAFEDVTWEEACIVADRLTSIYRGHPHGREAAALFAMYLLDLSESDDEVSDFMDRCVGVVQALRDYEADEGEHPAPELAHEIFLSSELRDPNTAVEAAAIIPSAWREVAPDEPPCWNVIDLGLCETDNILEAASLGARMHMAYKEATGEGAHKIGKFWGSYAGAYASELLWERTELGLFDVVRLNAAAVEARRRKCKRTGTTVELAAKVRGARTYDEAIDMLGWDGRGDDD